MVYQWLISKKNIIFIGFRRSNIFQGGKVQIFRGGGVQMLISIETHRTCDFQGGGGSGPPIPLWICACICKVSAPLLKQR